MPREGRQKCYNKIVLLFQKEMHAQNDLIVLCGLMRDSVLIAEWRTKGVQTPEPRILRGSERPGHLSTPMTTF